MNKKYKKPFLSFEYFTLTQSVANGCGASHWDDAIGGPNHWDKHTCGWTDTWGEKYWTSGVGVEKCGEGLPEDYPLEGVCYNNPNPNQTIFNS